jgi:hypothetical protein
MIWSLNAATPLDIRFFHMEQHSPARVALPRLVGKILILRKPLALHNPAVTLLEG